MKVVTFQHPSYIIPFELYFVFFFATPFGLTLYKEGKTKHSPFHDFSVLVYKQDQNQLQ